MAEGWRELTCCVRLSTPRVVGSAIRIHRAHSPESWRTAFLSALLSVSTSAKSAWEMSYSAVKPNPTPRPQVGLKLDGRQPDGRFGKPWRTSHYKREYRTARSVGNPHDNFNLIYRPFTHPFTHPPASYSAALPHKSLVLATHMPRRQKQLSPIWILLAILVGAHCISGAAAMMEPRTLLPVGDRGHARAHHRHRQRTRPTSAAHTWACSLVDQTLARLTAFVMSGSNMLDSYGAAVRETWGSALHPGRLLVFSDGNGTAQGGITLAGTGGDHGGSQKKWPLAFQHYCGSPGLTGLRNSTDWLLVADDDTYAFLPNLAALLTLGFSPDWPYVLGRPWRAEGVTYPCGGPGYVLSRAAMDRVCARVEDFLTHHWPSYWSDINMGGYLQTLNITFVPLDGLYLRNYQAPGVKRIAPNLKDDAIIPELAVGQPLSNHWASPDEMRRLHAAHGMGDIVDACYS